MPIPARPVPTFPPTPEDEAVMADLRPGGSHLAPMQIDSLASPGQLAKPDDRLDEAVKGILDTPASPSLTPALSRFEFEPGKGNEGTKVLLVEWDGLGTTNNASGPPSPSNEYDWVVSWEGKASHNVLAASESAVDVDGGAKRLYFLLPPGATIPTRVSITRRSKSGRSDEGNQDSKGTTPGDSGMMLWAKPLPAIYPDADEAGGRGVLHTLWAKQRLAGLATEIETEMKANSESIGLQIALQEQEWVAEHFGVGAPNGARSNQPYLPSPESPTVRIAMPRSPIGGKLGEKLRGLKLATSPADLAVSSRSKPRASTSTIRSAAAISMPRPSVFSSRSGLHTSIELYEGVQSSLDAVIQDSHVGGRSTDTGSNVVDGEDELFALPLSPRSPEMARSPFSLL